MRTPQTSQVGAIRWAAHSTESKVSVSPEWSVTVNALS